MSRIQSSAFCLATASVLVFIPLSASAVDRVFETFDNGMPASISVERENVAVESGFRDGPALVMRNGAELYDGSLFYWNETFEAGQLRFDVYLHADCCQSLRMTASDSSNAHYYVGAVYENERTEFSRAVDDGWTRIHFEFDNYSDEDDYVVIDNLRYLSDALDADGDFMADDWETSVGLNPLSDEDVAIDSDGDGVSNEWEYWYDIDPTSADSDSDGMDDGFEIDHALNPNDPADAIEDTDDDGLTNRQEAALGTSPRKVDTDHDGIADKQEHETTLTDPRTHDSDNDGYDDAEEIEDGTDPLDATDFSGGVRRLHYTFAQPLGDAWAVVAGAPAWIRERTEAHSGPFALKADLSNADDVAQIELTRTFDQGRLQYRVRMTDYDQATSFDSLSITDQDVKNGIYDIDYRQIRGWKVRTQVVNQGDRTIRFKGSLPTERTLEGRLLLDDVRYLAVTEDVDGDMMPDAWERQRGFDPESGTDDFKDRDNDGLSNVDEYWAGTDPDSSDTDADGFPDAWELAVGLDPLTASDGALDTDGDGISDADEYSAGTSPNNPDSDSDGLDDFQETTVHMTDPLALDSDEDGLSDYDEIQVLSTDANQPDSDGDGISDFNETDVGTDPLNSDDHPTVIDLVRERYVEGDSAVWAQGEENDADWSYFVSDAFGPSHRVFGFLNAPTSNNRIEWSGYFASGKLRLEFRKGYGLDLSIYIDGEPDDSCYYCSSPHVLFLDEGMHTIAIEVQAREHAQNPYFAMDGTYFLAHTLDADGDNAPDAWENEHGTEVGWGNDLDEDGMRNDAEYRYGTEPSVADSDDDGLPDGFETRHAMNPLDAQDAQRDHDGDGLTEIEEYQYGTGVFESDNDHDGLLDGEEVHEYESDPKHHDSDGDGIFDGQEVNEHGTDPTLVDTDGDGYTDDTEIRLGVDATDAQARPEVITERFYSFESGLPDEWSVMYGTPDITTRKAVDGTRSLSHQGWGVDVALEGMFGNSDISFYVDSGSGSVTARTRYETKHFYEKDEGTHAIRTRHGADFIAFELDEFGDGPKPLIDAVRISPSDSDLDGLPDYWEQLNGFDPDRDVEAQRDADGDGLTLPEEYQWGSDDERPDTDADGLMDFWEVHAGTRVLVADNDNDPDGDGLTNLEEQQQQTSPLMADSDQDGMEDGWEVTNGLDPLTANGDADEDGDGLSNHEEHDLALDPAVADTDGDGLSDAWEVNHGTDATKADAGSDPDADGLSNFEEQGFKTDPHRADSDSDGLPDGWEIDQGLNPLLAADAAADYDGDGKTNRQEYADGTDPHVGDSKAGALGVWLGLALVAMLSIRRRSVRF